MKSEFRSLYRRFFYDDAREPSKSEGDLLTKIIPLVAALLLAADSIRRYLEILAPSEIFKYSQHLLLAITLVSLVYIATRVRTTTPTTTEIATQSSEFVYPRRWRLLAKVLILPAIALYVSGLLRIPEPAIRFVSQNPVTRPTVFAIQTPIPNQTSIATPNSVVPQNALGANVSNYRSNDIAYDLIVQNTGSTQQILTEIGVHSHVNVGWGHCMAGGSGPMAIAANYTVRFHVAEPETKYPMDPPLVIQPNDAVRFTVSLIPSDLGSCGVDWKSQVSVFVTNARGESIETQPREITPNDIRSLSAHEYSFEEIIDVAANSTDPYSRAEALLRISSYLTPQNEGQIVSLLMASLLSSSSSVRSASIRTLAELNKTQAVPDIISLLKNDPEEYVRYSAAEALGQLNDASAIDALGYALSHDQKPDVRIRSAEALGKLGGSKALGYLIESLRKETNDNTLAFIAHSLIQLEAAEAVPQLSEWMKSNPRDSSFEVVVRYIFLGDPAYGKSFLPTLFEILEGDTSSSKRRTVAINLRDVPNNGDVVKALERSAMSDPDAEVRADAIQSLGTLASPSAIEALKGIASSQRDPTTKAAALAELQELGQ